MLLSVDTSTLVLQSRFLLTLDFLDCGFLVRGCLLDFGLKNRSTTSRKFSCCRMLTILTIFSEICGTFKFWVFSLRTWLIFGLFEVPSTLRHFLKLRIKIFQTFSILFMFSSNNTNEFYVEICLSFASSSSRPECDRFITWSSQLTSGSNTIFSFAWLLPEFQDLWDMFKTILQITKKITFIRIYTNNQREK